MVLDRGCDEAEATSERAGALPFCLAVRMEQRDDALTWTVHQAPYGDVVRETGGYRSVAVEGAGRCVSLMADRSTITGGLPSMSSTQIAKAKAARRGR